MFYSIFKNPWKSSVLFFFIPFLMEMKPFFFIQQWFLATIHSYTTEVQTGGKKIIAIM